MEADSILNMEEDASHKICFIIDVIVNDYYSTIQAVLNHPSRGAQYQVLKSSYGNMMIKY